MPENRINMRHITHVCNTACGFWLNSNTQPSIFNVDTEKACYSSQKTALSRPTIMGKITYHVGEKTLNLNILHKELVMSFRIAFVIIALFPLFASAQQKIALSPPPNSLKQWYKPDNKRQVWLHTMFTLRRAMQATEEYAALEDGERLKKWAKRFADAYRKLPEMVPEWADEVDLNKLKRLEQAAAKGDFAAIGSTLRKLGTTCRSCHNEYKSVAVIVMRSPDYGKIMVEDSETLEEVPYDKSMVALRTQINRIKIGVEDNRWSSAQTAAEKLKQMLTDLGEGCGKCHRGAYPKERILGKVTQEKLNELDAALDQQNMKNVGKLLGHIGYAVCARCHGVHRPLADIRTELLP